MKNLPLSSLRGWFTIVALVGLVGLVSPSVSGATPTELDESSGGTFAITSTNNLLLNNLASANYTSNLAGQEGYAIPSGTNNVLVNGSFGATRPADDNTTVASLTDNFSATFNLDLTANPNGYVLSSIEVFGGWNDGGRDRQHYIVSYQPVSGGAFIPFATVLFEPAFANVTINTKVTLTNLGLDAVAVRALQFSFPGQELSYAGYREISAFGTVSTVATASPPTVTNSPSNSDTFTTSTNVTITNTEVGGTTYYTLDGSTPTTASQSTTTSAVVPVSANATVNAYAVSAGKFDSAVVTRTLYVLLPALTGLQDVNSGVYAQYYKVIAGGANPLPDFPNLVPTANMVLPNFTLAANVNPFEPGGDKNDANNNNYSIQMTGYINAPSDGLYQFSMASDDGSRLFIDNTLVIDDNFNQGFGNFLTKPVGLLQGKHAIRVQFAEGTGDAQLQVNWQVPGGTMVEVPNSVLTSANPSANPSISPASGLVVLNSAITITNNAPGGTTYYTIDGSKPTTASASTTSSATTPVTGNITVKAYTVVPAQIDSDVVSNTYTSMLPALTGLQDTFSGVRADYYKTNAPAPTPLPDFDNLVPDSAPLNLPDFTLASNVNPFDPNYNDHYSIKFTGYINVPTDGVYTFYEASDDASRTVIDGVTVVDSNRLQGFNVYDNGSIALQQGKHAIKVLFAENDGGAQLEVHWKVPGGTEVIIPNSVLTTGELPVAPTITLSGGGTTFASTAQVVISSQLANPTTYYTLDGSTPTVDSYAGIYTGPISINKSVTVKAFSVKAGVGTSLVSTASFTRTNPELALASAKYVSPTAVDATFNTAVTAVGTYAITGGSPVTVQNAVVDGTNPAVVHLTVAPGVSAFAYYTLTATGTQSSGGAIGTHNAVTFRGTPDGATGKGVYFEKFDNLDGSLVTDLTNSQAFINNTPSSTQFLPNFNFTTLGDRYGTRMRAIFTVPAGAGGKYNFQITGDDQTQVFIATDGNPATKSLLLTCQVSTVATTTALTLTAGQQIYLEVLMKEGGGGDYAMLKWAPENSTAFDFVPNASLTPYIPPEVFTAVPQGLLRQFYDGIPGNDVVLLTSNAKYPNFPDQYDVVPTFLSPDFGNNRDNYGLRLSGFYIPAADADVNFYVVGDDGVELWMSPDANPANAVKICQKVNGGPNDLTSWTVKLEQQSPATHVVAGTKYYMFALEKEGGGGDGVAVTVAPVGVDPTGQPAIAGKFLVPDLKPFSIAQQGADRRVRYGTDTTLSVAATGGARSPSYQWFQDGVAINGATSKDLPLTAVTGAATGNYTCVLSGSADGFGVSQLTCDPIHVQVFAQIAIDTATLTQMYDSTPRVVTATSTPVGLAYSVTYGGQPTAVNAGTYAVAVSATNGVDATASGSLVVSPAAISSVAVASPGASIPYDGQSHPSTATTTPPGLAVTITYNGSATAPKDAGVYTIVATINDANAVGNSFDNTQTRTITKVDVEAHADAKTRVYGDTTAIALTYTVNGLVNNETAAAVVTGAPTLATTAVAAVAGTSPGSVVGTYPITIDFGSLAATNYNFNTHTDDVLTVTKRGVGLQVNPITLEYGAPNPATLPYTVDLTSLAPGETVATDAIQSGQPGLTSARTPTSGTGVYPITFTAGTLVFTANYQLGAVTPASVTVVPTTTALVSVPDTTVPYSAAPQGIAPVTTPGGLHTDITYNGSATVPTNAGTYAVVATVNDTNSAVTPSGNGTLTIVKATAVVGINTLFQQYDGQPKPVSIATSPAGLNVNVTYNGSGTAPILPGIYTVVATANDTNYAGTKTATLRVDGPAPVITSALTATPSVVQVGKTVTFSVAATHPLGTALTITYDYGDGTSDTTGLHSYNFPQVATVTAFVSDGLNTITSTMQVLVISAASPGGDLDGDGIPNSMDDDADGDGLSDAFENAAGSSPLDPNSTPLTDPTQAKNPGPLDVKKMTIALNFKKTLADSVSITGTLPVKAGYVGLNQKVVIDVGGVVKAFTLTAKNTAKVGGDTFKVTVKAKKGVVSADQAAKFAVKFAKGTFSTSLADDGLANQTLKNKALTVRVDVLFTGQFLRKLVPQVYTAKQGTSGRTK